MRYLFLLLTLGGLCSLPSCKKDPSPAEQLQIDLKKIQQYLTDKGLTAQSTPSGLHYIITTEGTGGHPNLQSTVTVKYKGKFLDGAIFDETQGSNTATFPLSNLIEGWQEGIPLLKKSGKGTFLVPSALAYGPSGQGQIGANEVLLFEIELVGF